MPAIVVGRDSTGAILHPAAIGPRRRLVRELTWLGSDLNDYNAPLLVATFSARFDRARFWRCGKKLRAACRAHPRLHYDIIALQKMPETVGAQPNPMRHFGGTINPSGAYLTHLTGDWETFYTDKRSSATRRRDRTKRKKLSEFGELASSPGDRGRHPADARHADGAEGELVRPHGRRQSVRQAGPYGILSRARHRSGDEADRACQPARRRHGRCRGQSRADLPRLLLSLAGEL